MSDHENTIRDAFLYSQGFDIGGWPAHLRPSEVAERGETALDALLAGHADELDRLRQELRHQQDTFKAQLRAGTEEVRRERDEARAENERLAGALDDMVDWAERYRGGDKKLHPEEFYIRRDYARKLLKDRAAIAAAQEPTANYVGGAGYPLGPQEPPATDDLPNDLARVLRDQSVIVPQDAAVFDLIAQWAKAPSTTASADPLPAQEPPAEEGEMRRG